MNILFLILDLVALIGLLLGLAKPSWVKMPSRKRAGIIFGGAFVVFFILFGVTAPPVSPAGSTQAQAPSNSVAETVSSTPTSTEEKPVSDSSQHATQSQTAAVPSAPAQTPTPAPAPAPTELPAVADTAYIQKFENTVEPLLGALNVDIMTGQAEIGNSNIATSSVAVTSDVSAALSDFQQGRSDLSQAQSALQAMQGDVPTGMTSINTFANEFLTSEAKVLTIFIGDVSNNTLSSSDMLSAYAQLNQSNSYQGQMNGAIQQWQSANY